MFVLRRGHVPQRGVPTPRVVEDLDVLHDRRPGLRSCGEVRPVDQLLLQGGEEALQGGVVPALANLPDAERAEWQKLWADVAALLDKAEAGGKE